MVAQGVLPFQYQAEEGSSGMTALAGLPVYLELLQAMGLRQSIERRVKVREETQGWTDAQVICSLVLLNLAGGESVDDLGILEADGGFAQVLRRVETHGMSQRERRALKRRWRKPRRRAVPSPSAVFRYLEAFHDEEQEGRREPGKAFIPLPGEPLLGLRRINCEVAAFVQSHSPQGVATLDIDATLVETHKSDAFYCYKHFKAYQPLNVYWAEQELVVHSEFRDGNVPAGYEQLRVFQEALASMPPGVGKVYHRSDTAGYQQDLLKYCAQGRNKRFGVIEFAIGADVTPAFRAAVAELAEKDWHPIGQDPDDESSPPRQEWAEVCFVPAWAGHSKNGPDYRFLAIREPLHQLELPGLEDQICLPFPTMDFADQRRYKLFGLVTNRDLPGQELIRWHRERCGKSEEAHAVMKEDLAGGRLPSGNFGANAAWWAIMILAFNLHAAMKRIVLGGEWAKKRMKAMRFKLIHVPGRLVRHARGLLIRLSGEHPSFQTLLDARRTILTLAHAPPPP